MTKRTDVAFGRRGQSDAHKVTLVEGRVYFRCGDDRRTFLADVLQAGERKDGQRWKAWCTVCEEPVEIVKIERKGRR